MVRIGVTMKKLLTVFALPLAFFVIGTRVGVGESTQKGTAMRAQGTFDVTVTPQKPTDSANEPFQSLLITKQFHGDLEATSKGQMLGSRGPIEGSGGYVALELVTGKLNGKAGSFVLQHKGTMRKGTFMIDVTVVPDSGTEQLTGIAGSMTIVIEGSKHSYSFDYTLNNK
jgi:hypothetical protein